jgi:hypothetical protein
MKKAPVILLFFIITCAQVNKEITTYSNNSMDYQPCKIFNNKEPAINQIYDNRILVVGHAYGSVGGNNTGLSQNLLDFFSRIEINEKTILVLTGDFVRDATLENLQKVKEQVEIYFNEYYIVPGNHEFSESENFYRVFEKDFFEKLLISTHIIGANFNTSNWLPALEDQDKINDIIEKSKTENIVLFSHQLFWFEIFEEEIRPNGYQLYENSQKINPLEWIINTTSKIYIISGDSGAWNQKFFCKSSNQGITMIANGIGDFDEDMIIEIIDSEEGLFFNKLEINNP